MSILAIIEKKLTESEFYSKFDLDPKQVAKAYLIYHEQNDRDNEYDDGYNPSMTDAFTKEFGDSNFRSPAGEHANWLTLAETIEECIIKALKAEIEESKKPIRVGYLAEVQTALDEAST